MQNAWYSTPSTYTVVRITAITVIHILIHSEDDYSGISGYSNDLRNWKWNRDTFVFQEACEHMAHLNQGHQYFCIEHGNWSWQYTANLLISNLESGASFDAQCWLMWLYEAHSWIYHKISDNILLFLEPMDGQGSTRKVQKFPATCCRDQKS